MTRTSPAEVRGLFRRVVAAAGLSGIRDADLWELLPPVMQDRPWHLRGPNDAAGRPMFLGETARQAALSLMAMERAFSLVPAREGVR